MATGRSACSHAVEGEASSNQGATSPHNQTVVPTQTAPSRHPTTMTRPQNEAVAQLLPVLVAIQEAERLVDNWTTQHPVSTPASLVIEPIIDEAIQGVTPTNTDNSSAAKRPVVPSEEPSLYFTKVEIEAMFKKERDRATILPKTLDLKPTYPNKVVEKEFPADYKVPKFQKFMVTKETPKSMSLSSILWGNM